MECRFSMQIHALLMIISNKKCRRTDYFILLLYNNSRNHTFEKHSYKMETVLI